MKKYTLDWYLSLRRPAPIKDITEWATRKVMTNYFVYQMDGKKKVGYCTACGKSISTEKASKGRYLVCQKCGEKIKAKADSDFVSEYENVLVGYLDKYNDFFLHRIFRVARSLSNKKQETRIEECQMQVLAFPLEKTVNGYAIGFSRQTMYKNDNMFTRYADFRSPKRGEHWERGSIAGFSYNIFSVVHHTYPYNLKEIFLGTKWQYSELWTLAETDVHFNLFKALLCYVNYPQLEYVIKLNLYKIAGSIICGSIMCDDDDNVIKFLGLNNAENLRYVIEQDMSGADLEVYRRLLRKKLPINEASFKLCHSMVGLWHNEDEILKIMSAQSFYDYYLTQKKIKKTLSYKTLLRDYFDHISTVKALGLDIKDTMYSKPKDFYSLHAKLSAELSFRKNKEKYEKVENVLKTEKSYEFTDGNLSLIVPKTAQEIVDEGKVQNHCVGTYLDRVAEKRSVIAFIRKKNDLHTPFYTIEINPATMTVVQCRGFKNGDQTTEVKAFVRLYAATVLAQKLDKLKKEKSA